MELVRELSLCFADDGKRVKVFFFATISCFLALYLPMLDYLLHIRSVFKVPWVKEHLLVSHFNWLAPENFWKLWTGVTMRQRIPSLILEQ
jgi:hypothetical protein